MPGPVVTDGADRGYLGTEPGECHRLVERLAAGRGADRAGLVFLAPARDAGGDHPAVGDVRAHHGEAQILNGPVYAARPGHTSTLIRRRCRQR